MSSSSQFDLYVKMIVEGIEEAAADFKTMNTAITDYSKTAETGGKSTDSLGKTIAKQKPGLMQLGTSFGTVTAAGWSLYNTYDALEKTKVASTKADQRVRTSTLAVQDAQQKYTDTLKKYGEGSAEAAEAAAELEVKQIALANAQEVAGIRAEDVTEAYAQFATTLPTMILSIASAGTAFQKMVVDMGGIHKITPRVTSALQAVGGGFKAILMNPIGIVLTAAAVAFTLLATNAFGVRDALNGLGKAIGDALPGLKAFLDLIGGAANWFLNLINPVGEASAQLDTLGTSATGTGTAMEGTQTLVEGLNGAMVDQSAVVKDVITDFQNWQTQQAELEAAYQAWKDAQVTGNTDLVDSYNLTGEEITKFKERYAKEMEDAKKAAEDAAKDAYEAWKKSIEDSRKEVEKGFGVLESTFSTIQSDIATALDEGGKEFKKVLKKYGLDPDNPLVMDAIVDWAVNTIDAENDITGFGLYVAQNIDQMKTATNSDFDAMVQQWVAYISEEEPKAAAAVGQWGTSMIAEMDRLLNTGAAKSPAEAFLRAIGNTLSPEAAQKIAKLFGVEFPDTTVEEFEKGKPKVEAAVATNITTPIATKIADGEKEAKTKLTTLIQNAIIGPITEAKPKVETESVSIVGAFTKLVTDASAEIDKIGLAFTNIKWGDLGATVAKFGTDLSTAFTNYNWDQLGTDTTTAIVESMKWSSSAVTELGKRANEFGQILYEGLKQYGWVKLGQDVGSWVLNAVAWIQSQFTEKATNFGNYLWDALKVYKWVDVGASVGKLLADSLTWAGDVATTITKKVNEFGKAVGDAVLKYPWADVGGGIWNAIVSGITGAGKALGDLGAQGQDLLGQLGEFLNPWKKTAAGGGGGGGPVIVNEMMGIVDDLKGGAGGGGGLGIAKLFGQEMTLALSLVTAGTAKISAQFLVMKQSITLTMTGIQTILGAFASTALTTIATAVSTQTTLVSAHFLTMKNSVTITITALQTLLGAFASTTLSTIATAVSTQTTVMSAAFLTMKTSVSTQIIALQTLLGAFASTTLSTVASAVTQQTTTMSASFLTMKTSIALSIAGIITEITKLTTTTATQFAKIDTSTKTTGTAFTTLGTTVSTQTTAMTTKINSFSSAMVSAMDKITKAMDAAKKSADALKKSIDALKDKTITITTRYVTSGSPAGQHGYQGIIGAPGNVGGVKVGEGFRPELITVTPLTRGTGNHYGATMGGGFGSPGGRGGGEVVNNITVVLDGRVIQRFVEKTALAGIGMQI